MTKHVIGNDKNTPSMRIDCACLSNTTRKEEWKLVISAPGVLMDIISPLACLNYMLNCMLDLCECLYGLYVLS